MSCYVISVHVLAILLCQRSKDSSLYTNMRLLVSSYLFAMSPTKGKKARGGKSTVPVEERGVTASIDEVPDEEQRIRDKAAGALKEMQEVRAKSKKQAYVRGNAAVSSKDKEVGANGNKQEYVRGTVAGFIEQMKVKQTKAKKHEHVRNKAAVGSKKTTEVEAKTRKDNYVISSAKPWDDIEKV
jgi:hypothetical protein